MRFGEIETQRSDNGYRIVIRAGQRLRLVVPASIWLLVWVGGGTRLVGTMSAVPAGLPAAFVSFWCVAWALGGLAVAWALLLRLFGSEVITLRGDTMTVQTRMIIFHTNRSFNIGDISNVRLEERQERARGYDFKSRSIAFDYQGNVVTLRSRLSKEAGEYIVKGLLPEYLVA
jgi:hypothetical protein